MNKRILLSWIMLAVLATPVCRAAPASVSLPPTNMVLIPAGSFKMGDVSNPFAKWKRDSFEVKLSSFYIDQYEVTGALWDEVYLWATNHGYSFKNRGAAKASNHPVHSITWDEKLKWCNARSEKEGREPVYYADEEHNTVYRQGLADVFNRHVKWEAKGYRLPTEAEWEKAAWGGHQAELAYEHFHLTQQQANFRRSLGRPDEGVITKGYCVPYFQGQPPYTSPVGSFPPNGYGLYDMAGNVREACWDIFYMWPNGTAVFAGRTPHGFDRPANGVMGRVVRGGSWAQSEIFCHPATTDTHDRYLIDANVGFRTVISAE